MGANIFKLYNTESRRKEGIVSLSGGKISFYACGPTVYDYAHIGNFRTYVFEDILRKSLEYFGFKVVQVMNITDIDDKIIRGVIKGGKSLNEYTKFFEDSFFEDIDRLNIKRADYYPHATDYVWKMVEIIENLLEKGVAYNDGRGNIFCSISKFSSYGRLSHLNLDELRDGGSGRVLSDEYEKIGVGDFSLWKAYDKDKDGDIFYEASFGRGRPGWHIECSAMALDILGNTIDIHSGGVDNIFPHHENEILQSEMYTGERFVRYWVHSEHLLVDGRKMSKSLGNFYTVRDLFEKGYSGDEIRYLLIQTHYRNQLNFTLEGLKGAKLALGRISDFIRRMMMVKGDNDFGLVGDVVDKALADFGSALADDLNMSLALSCIFDLIRGINHLCDDEKVGECDAKLVLDFLKKVNEVLGVLKFDDDMGAIPSDVLDLVNKREVCRGEKDWVGADKYRKEVEDMGYVIEDGAAGFNIKKKR